MRTVGMHFMLVGSMHSQGLTPTCSTTAMSKLTEGSECATTEGRRGARGPQPRNRRAKWHHHEPQQWEP